MCDQNERSTIFHRAVGYCQVVFMQVEDCVAGRSTFGVPDRARGDYHVPAVVGDLPVMSMAADDGFDPLHVDECTPCVNARSAEILPDLVGIVVLENHDPLVRGDGQVEFITQPADLFGRDTQRSRLLRVEPDESDAAQGERAVRRTDVPPERLRRRRRP